MSERFSEALNLIKVYRRICKFQDLESIMSTAWPILATVGASNRKLLAYSRKDANTGCPAHNSWLSCRTEARHMSAEVELKQTCLALEYR